MARWKGREELVDEIVRLLHAPRSALHVGVVLRSGSGGAELNVLKRFRDLPINPANKDRVTFVQGAVAPDDADDEDFIRDFHHKYMLYEGFYDGVWRRLIWTGSANFTRRGVSGNDEIVARLENDQLYGQYLAHHKDLKKWVKPKW